MEERYNGYTNWETWNMVNWLINEEDTQAMFRKLVGKRSDALDVLDKAVRLKNWVKTTVLKSNKTMRGGFKEYEIKAVDWQEIVETHIEN